MSILPIYLFGTSILKKKAKPVLRADDSLHKLVYDMFETMKESNGVGLAAPQVGDEHRVIVIDIQDVDEGNAEGETEDAAHPTSPDLPRTLALINPEIIESVGMISREEGCLSLPALHGDIERPEKVRVRFLDPELREQEVFADGFLARVIQHEMDHLEGILFIDRMSTTKRSLLLPKLRKIRKGDVDTDYPVISAAGQ
jgi:peptide deformylase